MATIVRVISCDDSNVSAIEGQGATFLGPGIAYNETFYSNGIMLDGDFYQQGIVDSGGSYAATGILDSNGTYWSNGILESSPAFVRYASGIFSTGVRYETGIIDSSGTRYATGLLNSIAQHNTKGVLDGDANSYADGILESSGAYYGDGIFALNNRYSDGVYDGAGNRKSLDYATEAAGGTYKEATTAQVQDGVMFGANSALEGTFSAGLYAYGDNDASKVPANCTGAGTLASVLIDSAGVIHSPPGMLLGGGDFAAYGLMADAGFYANYGVLNQAKEYYSLDYATVAAGGTYKEATEAQVQSGVTFGANESLTGSLVVGSSQLPITPLSLFVGADSNRLMGA